MFLCLAHITSLMWIKCIIWFWVVNGQFFSIVATNCSTWRLKFGFEKFVHPGQTTQWLIFCNLATKFYTWLPRFSFNMLQIHCVFLVFCFGGNVENVENFSKWLQSFWFRMNESVSELRVGVSKQIYADSEVLSIFLISSAHIMYMYWFTIIILFTFSPNYSVFKWNV